MASIIKIKRSSNPGTPTKLGQGEMAYSYASGSFSTLGDRLFIGTGTETVGNAAVHSAIGGLYYTRLIDASVPGTLTTFANSVPVLSSTGTIDRWYVGNVYTNNNTISTTNVDGNLNLSPNGNGMVQIASTWTLPRGAGSNNYVLKTNGTSTADWAEPKTYIGSTAVNLFNSSDDVSTITNLNLNGGNYSGNYVKVSDIGFGPAIGTTNSDSAVRIETGASGTVNHLWTFNADGTTTFNGAYTLPNVDATSAGYVLSSDAAGTASWTALPSTGNLDSITTSGNTTTNGITIGRLTIDSGSNPYTLPTVDGSAGYILATYGNGEVYWTSAGSSPIQPDWNQTDTGALDYIKNKPNLANVATSGDYNDLINVPEAAAYLNIQGDSGTGNVALLTHTLDFVGVGSVSTVVSNVGLIDTVSISVANASYSTTGVASFNSANFDITDAQVSLKTGGITNSNLANANVTIGSTVVELGSTVTAFAGLTSFQVGNIKIYNDNQITTQETNGNINLIANGIGTVDVNNTRITSLAGPEGPFDAVNRSYVDAVASGLHVHLPADVATTANLATITGGTVTYYNGPTENGTGATITLSNAITIIDGQTYQDPSFPVGSRILVKNEANAAHNGIYIIDEPGTTLTRADDFDSAPAIHGGDFVFVQSGTLYMSTGWVQTVDTVEIGVSDIIFSQFAGPGTYRAGIGLYLDGTTFNANVNSSSGGIEIVANQFQLKSTLAGDGLTYGSGILTVGGTTNRISVSADAIDISVNYVGQTSITTLGTISTGTWHGNTIASGYGGTGFTSYSSYDLLVGNGSTNGLSILAKGTGGQVLQMNSAGTALLYDDLDGGTY
jgi:hypothetical protein